jgi:predicted acyl esterase
VTTVDWLVTSSDDRLHDAPIGTIGDSGLSLTQYLLAGTLHPNVKACFTRKSPPSVYEFLFDDGIYRREAMDRWLGLQLGDAGRDAYLEENAISHPDRTDGWWDPIDVFATHPILGQPLSSLIDVPTYFVSGHFDLFRRQQVRLFEALRSNGTASASNQLLRVGPWSHTNSTGTLGSLDGRTLPGFPGHAVSIAADAFVFEALKFFDNWVRGPPSTAYDPPRVVYFRMGDTTTSGPWNEWVLADDFPAHDARDLLLLADGVLSPEELTPRLPHAPVGRAYVSDPSCPVPTKGGDTLFSSTVVADCLQPSLREPIGDGPWDQDDPTLPLGSRIDRSDVLSWTGEVLGTPLEVTGTVSAHLAFSSDAPDIDLVVKLMDVRPDGRSLLIVEGAGNARYRNGLDQPTCLSRNPNEIATIDIDLGFTSYVFDAGHRLRVAVSSSDHPRLEVNPQNGCSFRSSGGPHDCPGGCTSQAPFVATNQIWCFEGNESSITLPVVQ